MSLGYKIGRECLLLILAVMFAYVASMYLAPWYVTEMSSNVVQTGWPIAFWTSRWVDYSNNKSAAETSFDLFSLALDIGLFYILIRLLSLGLARARGGRKNDA